MTEIPPLLAFLNARLDEDERLALLPDAHDWRYPVNGVVVDRDVDGWQSAPDAARIFSFVDPDRSDEAVHAVRHDPDRVLREVAIKRTLLVGHEQDVHRCAFGDFAVGDECRVQRILATAYVDHPDYHEEWRP